MSCREASPRRPWLDAARHRLRQVIAFARRASNPFPRLARELWLGLLDLLARPECRVCGSPLGADAALCLECCALIEWHRYACPRCAAPLSALAGEDERRARRRRSRRRGCAECRGRRWAFDRAVAAGPHEGALRTLVLAHKFHADIAALDALVAAIVWAVGIGYAKRRHDVVTWVPQHPVKGLLRGRDPGRELAERVARELGLPLRRLVLKRRWTPAQVDLSAELRRANLRGAFRPSRALRRSPPSRVLIVDDVLTTGTTLSECARVLESAGVGRVDVATVARTS